MKTQIKCLINSMVESKKSNMGNMVVMGMVILFSKMVFGGTISIDFNAEINELEKLQYANHQQVMKSVNTTEAGVQFENKYRKPNTDTTLFNIHLKRKLMKKKKMVAKNSGLIKSSSSSKSSSKI